MSGFTSQTPPREPNSSPDVHVSHQRRGGDRDGDGPATVVLPLTESEEQRFIQITDQHGLRVVTAVEVLCPSNKAVGPDRDSYLAKRNEFLKAGVNLVEMDRLRAGTRLPLGDPAPAPTDSYVLVCRAWERPRAGFWAVGLATPFPTSPFPLTRRFPKSCCRCGLASITFTTQPGTPTA